MRIAFASWRDLAHAQAGGSELVVDRLATGLSERGHEVALMCGGPTGPRAYPVIDLGGTFSQYLRAPLVHARRFRSWDLLVDVENGIPYFSPWWRSRPSLCLVHHVHTDQWATRFPAPLAALGRRLESRVMPRAYRNHLFAAVSPSTARALAEELGVHPDRVRTIRWGTDPPDRPPPAEAAEPRFLVLGRLVPHKQVDVILRAWARVWPVIGGHLVIAGDGPDGPRLTGLASEGVVFAGRVDEAEKARLLGRAWCLVHAASHEGWGIVIMEAAAAGRPTVALDAPGVRDAVVDGVTGLLADGEDALVRHWLAVGGDAGLRHRLGANARRRAAEFTWARSLDDFEAVADEAAGAVALRGVAA